MRTSKIENLLKVKTELAKKYSARADQANSKTRRSSYRIKANRYLRQTQMLQTMLDKRSS